MKNFNYQVNRLSPSIGRTPPLVAQKGPPVQQLDGCNKESQKLKKIYFKLCTMYNGQEPDQARQQLTSRKEEPSIVNLRELLPDQRAGPHPLSHRQQKVSELLQSSTTQQAHATNNLCTGDELMNKNRTQQFPIKQVYVDNPFPHEQQGAYQAAYVLPPKSQPTTSPRCSGQGSLACQKGRQAVQPQGLSAGSQKQKQTLQRFIKLVTSKPYRPRSLPRNSYRLSPPRDYYGDQTENHYVNSTVLALGGVCSNACEKEPAASGGPDSSGPVKSPSPGKLQYPKKSVDLLKSLDEQFNFVSLRKPKILSQKLRTQEATACGHSDCSPETAANTLYQDNVFINVVKSTNPKKYYNSHNLSFRKQAPSQIAQTKLPNLDQFFVNLDCAEKRKQQLQHDPQIVRSSLLHQFQGKHKDLGPESRAQRSCQSQNQQYIDLQQYQHYDYSFYPLNEPEQSANAPCGNDTQSSKQNSRTLSNSNCSVKNGDKDNFIELLQYYGTKYGNKQDAQQLHRRRSRRHNKGHFFSHQNSPLRADGKPGPQAGQFQAGAQNTGFSPYAVSSGQH